MAYIISGFRKEPKILIGRAGLRIPFLDRVDTLLVGQISIDIKTGGTVPTLDYIGVDIDAIAKIQVKTDAEGIKLAMKNFLNMNKQEIIDALTDSLQGNMREIVGTVTLNELCTNRKSFGDGIQEKAQEDMNRLGIKIISCNIQQIKDEQDLITQLGQDNMSQIQKKASIAKAEAERDIAIAQASAAREANDKKVESDTAIAEKQNSLAIRKAELKKAEDIKYAEANAAGQIEDEKQRRTIGVEAANADIARQEREVVLKQKEADVKEQELSASIRKQAEADRYRIEQQSQADLYRRQREAEAQKYERSQEAEAVKLAAEASLYEKQKEAEGIAATGRAEAEAIEAKGLAEAEALDKKAEAMKKYGEAAILEMVVDALPEMAKAIAEPLGNIDKITIIDGTGTGESGAGSVGNYVPQVLAKTIESVKETTGVDIADIMRSGTIQAKTDRHIDIKGAVPVKDAEEDTDEAGDADVPAEDVPSDYVPLY